MKRKPRQSTQSVPPRWAQRLLSWYCRPELLEDLQGDLNEYFERNLIAKGARKARLIYWLDVLKFFRPYTVRKPDFINLFIHWIMIGSYLKTSQRSLVRNKLFSFINIVGLAVSMSVGLLVITIVVDLNSYDDFHVKKDRIYRVYSNFQTPEQPLMELASTSVKVGKKIRETMTGVEEVTILRNGFGGDATVGEKIIPMGALYADASFFKVFTFPLLEGDPATALKEPYSLVLTEKTAKKLFGDANPVGKIVRFDTLNYTVTGLLRDVPKLSHIQFEALVSFATTDSQLAKKDPNFYGWDNIWQNYVYCVLPENANPDALLVNLNKLNKEENTHLVNRTISVGLQPLKEAALGRKMSNPIGPTMPPIVLWILAGLAFVIILSACFNYTNLSIARSLRRSREVGIRKIIGALKSHVLGQFMVESVIIALLALIVSFGLFLLLRSQFLALDPHLEELVALTLSPRIILYFIGMAVVVGLIAGFLPALFFSRINALQVIKDVTSIKVFRRVTMRKVLIVVQYMFSLIFIATTLIGYSQYRSFVNFDLGYNTENILNIKLQGNKGDLLVKELSEIPAVREISRSQMVTSLGSMGGTTMKYKNPNDSAMVWTNNVDEHYLPIHKHKLLAGTNFRLRPKQGEESEAIVNEQVLKRFNIANRNPEKAIGQVVTVDKKKLTIVGVLKDFHYGTVENKIEPVWLPRVALLRTFGPNLSAFVSISTGYSAPSSQEVHPSAGGFSTTLNAERGTSYEVGIRGSALNNHLRFDIALYKLQLKETIVRRSDAAGADYFINAGRTDQPGLEAQLAYDFIVPSSLSSTQAFTLLRLWNSLALINYRYRDYQQGTADLSNNRIPGVPPTTNVTGVDMETRSGFYAHLTYQFLLEFQLNDANTALSNPTQLLQATLGFRKNLGQHWMFDVYASGDNLLDRQYSLGYDLNAVGNRYYNAAPGRNGLGGVRLSVKW